MSGWARTERGLILPDRYAESFTAMTEGIPDPPGEAPPIGVSLFTGAGGMDLGFTQAGFHVAVAADNDPASAVTYLANMARYGQVQIHGIEEDDKDRLGRWLTKNKTHNGDIDALTEHAGSGWISHYPEIIGCQHYYFGNITHLTGERILNDLHMRPGDIDAVFGGPPCQGFSFAGKRAVMDPRNSMVFEFARLVLEINPKTMAMENVPGIVSMLTADGIPVIDAFCRVLADGGFGTVDALRKSLLATAGAGAAIRHQPAATETGGPKPADDEAAQLAMFG